MNGPLGHWIFTLAVSAGLISAPGSAGRPDQDLVVGSLCRAQLEAVAGGVFHGVGIVTEIDAETGALTLDHDDIIGLMPAMEMMYRVETPGMSRGLKIGDRVAFDLDGESYTILSVKVISTAN